VAERAEVRVGITTAVIGLLGVLAGGAISCAAQNRAVDRQLEATTAESKAIARGTARLMRDEFMTRSNDLQLTLDRGRFPREELDLGSGLPAESRRVVASALSRKQWDVVATANLRVAKTERLLARRQGDLLVAADRSELDLVIDRFDGAAEALNALSGER
jgi:hypothetical protein